MKSEASETAGCRVGKPGFRVAVFCSSGRGGGVSLSSVMEECGAVSLGQGIPFHAVVKKKKKGRRRGMGWVVLGLFLRRLRGGHRVPVAYFQFLENSGQAEPSQDNTAEQAPD